MEEYSVFFLVSMEAGVRRTNGEGGSGVAEEEEVAAQDMASSTFSITVSNRVARDDSCMTEARLNL